MYVNHPESDQTVHVYFIFGKSINNQGGDKK